MCYKFLLLRVLNSIVRIFLLHVLFFGSLDERNMLAVRAEKMIRESELVTLFLSLYAGVSSIILMLSSIISLLYCHDGKLVNIAMHIVANTHIYWCNHIIFRSVK